jgi:putative redox protein
MVTITGEYRGELHCSAVHGPSGVSIATDAPKDNQGRGEAFSPTDLVATGFATCIATTMAIVASARGVPEGALEKAANTCPVHQSLSPSIEKFIELIWE